MLLRDRNSIRQRIVMLLGIENSIVLSILMLRKTVFAVFQCPEMLRNIGFLMSMSI